MKCGVVVFPGSNCDTDLGLALQRSLSCEVVYLWHKETDLKGCDIIFLPGGFSYGDYLRSGAIAKLSPIMQSVRLFAQNGGFVMGICNGFQILCEAGLLEGALLRNTKQKFICDNVFLTKQNQSAVTQNIPQDKILTIPIAHGEGRFYIDADGLKKLFDYNLITYKYCDQNGIVSDASNPNGSIENIAGICNEGRNVFGMMPHPERAADSKLSNIDGNLIFESIAGWLQHLV